MGEQPQPLASLPSSVADTFDDLGQGVVVCGPDLRVVFANRAASTLLPPAQRGTHFGTLPDDGLRWLDGNMAQLPVDDVLTSGQPRSGLVVRIETAEGGRRYARTDIHPHHLEGGGQGAIVFLTDVTDVYAERDHRDRQEQYFRVIAENASDVIWHNAEDGTIAWISPSVTRVLGWRPEDLTGRFMTDIVHPDDQTPALRGRTRAAVGLTASEDIRLQRSDGTWCPMGVQGGPYFDPDGRRDGTVAIGRDISHIRSSHHRLEESERRFRLLADLVDRLSGLTEASALGTAAADLLVREIGDACVISLLDDAQEHLTPVAVAHHDPTRERALLPILDVGPVPWARTVSGPAIAVRRALHVTTPEFDPELEPAGRALAAYLHRFGTIGLLLVPLLVQGRIVGSMVLSRDGVGAPYEAADRELAEEMGRRIALYLRDRTLRDDLTRAQQALAASERTFREALHHAPIGTALVALDGRILEVNQALCGILGYDATELTARTVGDVTHPDDRETDVELARQLVSGAIPHVRVAHRCFRRDGRTIWVDVATSLVRSPTGEPVHFVTQFADVDSSRRSQQALEYQARHDALTGLLNRAELLRSLGERSADQRRPGRYFALLFCDLDHFRDVNDTFGHAAGDTVLRTSAFRICHRVRSADLVARMGGDEFVIVLDAVHATSEATAVAADILATVAQPVPLPTTTELVVPALSIGVVVATPGADVDALLAAADAALLDAKRGDYGPVQTHPAIMEEAEVSHERQHGS